MDHHFSTGAHDDLPADPYGDEGRGARCQTVDVDRLCGGVLFEGVHYGERLKHIAAGAGYVQVNVRICHGVDSGDKFTGSDFPANFPVQ